MAVQGDVNLIGERIDYNESLMLIPMAIPMATVIISNVRDDDSAQDTVSHARLFGCISSHFQGTAHVTVSMTSRGNHYAYHVKDHRNMDETLVVIGLFADEIEIPWGGGKHAPPRNRKEEHRIYEMPGDIRNVMGESLN